MSATPIPASTHAARTRRLHLTWTDSLRGTVGLIGILVITAVLYFWNLTENGYANSFYSAAAQAGSVSWKAFFYGSLDSANSITVDKPPASLWLMALSVRVFGLSSFAILLPQVLMGIATVFVLNRTVKRYFGEAAGLLAAGAMAITPVAVLMFRFNNPDALLVLLMTLGAWATLRAIDKGSIRWMALVGVFIGFGFLTKTLQAFLVVPFFGLAYLIAARTTLKRRLLGLAAAVGALVVAGGWWVAIVELVPSSLRPYVGGSQTDSFLELTFGYNGFGRITGDETGSVGGGGGGGGGPRAGSVGLARMFTSDLGGQISWLIPAALILTVAALVIGRRAARTDLRRASYLVWGGWFLVTYLVFAFMEGVFHQYYTVALSPAIAAMVGMGAADLWRRRGHLWARIVLGAAIAATGIWGYVLLTEQTEYGVWLQWLVLVTGLLGALGMVLLDRLARVGTWVTAAVVAIALVSAGAGQAAYAVSTVSTAKTGSIVVAGPSVSSGDGMGGGQGGPGGGQGQGGPGGSQGQGGQGGQGGPGGGQSGVPGGTDGSSDSSASQSGQGQGGQAGSGQGQGQAGSSQSQSGSGQAGGMPGGGQSQSGSGQGQGAPGAGQSGGPGGGGAAGGSESSQGGGMGGLLNGTDPDDEVIAALEEDADQYTWVAAAIGSQNAAGLQLATEDPVMAVGGFNGSDPSPTLAEFKAYVEAGEIHYMLASGSFGGQNGGSDAASEISEWVSENFTEVTIGSMTFYDLTQPVSSSSTTTES